MTRRIASRMLLMISHSALVGLGAADTPPITAPANAAQEQHAELGMTASVAKAHTQHPGAQWFPDAGLGLFIHWGIASVSGRTDLSWAMMANTTYDAAANGRNKMTPDDYWAQAKDFNPTKYDPKRWIKAAADAGFQYAVFTAMHHDGYTMWPTKYGTLGVQTALSGRDLVADYVAACHQYRMKVGLYYSPMDWYAERHYRSFNYGSGNQKRFPGRPSFNTKHQPIVLPKTPADFDTELKYVYLKRIRELLTNYGQIDILWLDGGRHDQEVVDLARELQPHIVINNRSCVGDFDHSECHLPNQRPTGWFETCDCWQASDLVHSSGKGVVDFWGYLKEENYKSTAWMIGNLAKLRGWGGNYLINVGPRPDGELPDVVYQRFTETKAWMDRNRESVIGTKAGPPTEDSNVPVTIKDRRYFLHMLPTMTEPAVLRNISKPVSVTLLRDGTTIPFAWKDQTLSITIPTTQRTDIDDVVVVQLP